MDTDVSPVAASPAAGGAGAALPRETKSARAGEGRLYAIDVMRFVAAVMVVATHWIGAGVVGTVTPTWLHPWGESTTKLFPKLLHEVSSYGWLGVQLFFLISGFVICMSSWGRSLGEFARSRITRLMPAYWFAVAVTAAVVLAIPAVGWRWSTPHVMSDMLGNLTMVQSAYNVPYLDSSYWTLFTELIFYIIFSVVVAWGLTYRRAVLFCAVWTVAAIVASATDDKVLSLLAQPLSEPYFVAGICFYLIYRFGPNMLTWGIIALSYLSALHLIEGDREAESGVMGWQIPWWSVAVVLTCFYALMALVALGKLNWVRWKWLTTLGALTYPVYLLHQDIGFTAISRLHRHIQPLPLVGILFVALIAGCWGVNRWVERPLATWLRKGIDQGLASIRQADSPLARHTPAPAAASAATAPIQPQRAPLPAESPEMTHVR